MPTDDDDEAEPRPRFRPLVLLVPVALLGAAGIFFYVQHQAHRELELAPGHPAGALVVAGSPPVLVLIDRVGKSAGAPAYRLTALDTQTGHPLGATVIEDVVRCRPAAPNEMTCEGDSGKPYLVEVPSFHSDGPSRHVAAPEPGCALADELSLGADHLAFGAGRLRPLVRHAAHAVDGRDLRPAGSAAEGRRGSIDGRDLRPAGSAAEGRRGSIDGRDLRPAGSAAEGRRGSIDGQAPRPAGSAAEGRRGSIDGRDLRPAGSAAEGRRGSVDDEPATENPSGAPSFVSPAFVRVSDPTLLLVIHDAAVDQPTQQLSRVDDTPHLLWTIEVGGRCESASLAGKTIVITTEDRAHRALAIDADTGKQRWQFAF